MINPSVLTAENEAKAKTVAEQDKALNTAWFVFGTKKELKDLPMKKGVISNRNKFVLGPSGSGKSFFMNHLVRQHYEQNSHIVLIDTGNSYQGLCELIHRKTKSEDGIYYTYTEEKPISFNPFSTLNL